jgi:hypothetical protein
MRLEENMLVNLICHEDDVFVNAQLADEAQFFGRKHLHSGICTPSHLALIGNVYSEGA